LYDTLEDNASDYDNTIIFNLGGTFLLWQCNWVNRSPSILMFLPE